MSVPYAFLLRYLLPQPAPANPIRPVPRRSRLAGSGICGIALCTSWMTPASKHGDVPALAHPPATALPINPAGTPRLVPNGDGRQVFVGSKAAQESVCALSA